MSRAHKPASAPPPASAAQMDDAEAPATLDLDSAAAASSAAQSTPAAAAAPAPTPRRSGRSRTSSGAGSAGSKRPSAASATSAPGASHASASIDDEDEGKQSDAVAAASAPAPSSKRARITKNTAAAPAAAAASLAATWSPAASSPSAAAQSSPMIRILGRDTGGQFVLCELLTLKEIAQLHRCCRSWRRWLNEGAFGSNRLLHLKSQMPLGLLSSGWAPRYVHRLVLARSSLAALKDEVEFLKVRDPGYNRWYRPKSGDDSVRCVKLAQQLLSRLSRVRALQMVLWCSETQIALPPGLILASATLQSLAFDVRRYRFHPVDPFTASFLRSIGQLPSLTSLHITSQMIDFTELDFSALPSLTQLQTLVILTGGVVRCSPAQVAALVACRALTALDVGVWVPVDMSSTKDAAQLQSGLIKLIRGRNLNGAARLRSIGLGTLHWKSVVTPAMAKTLLAMHELERLEHVVWSCELTSAHWAQLSLFTRLHTIHIGAVLTERTELSEEEDRATLQLDAPLLALQHCPLLSSVSLTGAGEFTPVLLSMEHAVLLAALPRLQSLFLRDVYVESLAPLTAAPALTHLTLDNCSGLGGKSFSVRSSIPRLPLLTSLSIELDPEYQHSGPESPREVDSEGEADDQKQRPLYPGSPPSKQFVAVNAALMERLPLLQPRAFKHSRNATNFIRRRTQPRLQPLWRPPVLRV